MATYVVKKQIPFIQNPFFTEQSTKLTVNVTSFPFVAGEDYTGASGSYEYLYTPETMELGMSLTQPTTGFNESNMIIPFEEFDFWIERSDGRFYYQYNDWAIEKYKYTFIELLRDTASLDIYICAKGENSEYSDDTCIIWHKCNLSLNNMDVGPLVTVTPSYTVTDSLSKTLTGNNKTIIRYVSDVNVTFTAKSQDTSTLKSFYIINGSQQITKNLDTSPTTYSASETFTDSDSPTFYITVTDSRKLQRKDFAQATKFIEYFKPTCRMEVGNVRGNGVVTVEVEGSAFNDTFGSQYNTIVVEYRYKEEGGSYSSWKSVTSSRGETTYSATFDVSGLTYTNKYIFQARVTDKVTSVSTQEIAAKSIPIFEWNRESFKFNVPVTFSDGERSSNDNAVLLWAGNKTMDPSTYISFYSPISEQPNGIVLVFSAANADTSWNSFFVPKTPATLFGTSGGHTFIMANNAGLATVGAKYLYITDTDIYGHTSNTSSGTAASGLTFNNSAFALRYVIGV